MSFGRRLERSETKIERHNDDDNKSNSKKDWQDKIDLSDDMELPDNSASKESYADVLENYLIPATEAESLEDLGITKMKTVKIKFFNKEWNVKSEIFSYSKVDPKVASRLIKSFISKSEEISKDMEASFCKMAQRENDDVGFKSDIKKYSDMTTQKMPLPMFKLKVGSIVITTDVTDKNSKPFLVVCGEYPVNDHGWCFKYQGGKWSGLTPDSCSFF
jgi:hypothetical protein